jgi:hypothetical protein
MEMNEDEESSPELPTQDVIPDDPSRQRRQRPSNRRQRKRRNPAPEPRKRAMVDLHYSPAIQTQPRELTEMHKNLDALTRYAIKIKTKNIAYKQQVAELTHAYQQMHRAYTTNVQTMRVVTGRQGIQIS